MLGRIPRFLLTPALRMGSRFQTTATGDVPILDLLPTQRWDLAYLQALADTTDDYRAIGAETLLMRGSRSPGYFARSIDALAGTIPHAHEVVLGGLGHSGPDDDGKPERVAEVLEEFFRA